MGDVFLQKTFTVDCLTKERVENDGIVPQYYIEDNHEGIVSKEIFHLAQQERAKRSNIYTGKRKKKCLHHGKYALSGIVTCEHCGDIFRRVNWNSRGSKSTVWRCVTRLEDHTQCSGRTVKEEILHQAILDALNQVIGEKGNCLYVLEKNLEEHFKDDVDEKIKAIDDELHEVQRGLLKTASQKDSYSEVVEQIFKLKNKKEEFLAENVANQEKRRRLSELRVFLKTQHTKLEYYEDNLVTRLVERVVVKGESFEITLKSGEVLIAEI